jgi:hypothetical protein
VSSLNVCTNRLLTQFLATQSLLFGKKTNRITISMPYFISFPKIKEKVALFQIVPLGPLNHIVPNLTLLTVDLVWIKYIFSYLLHKKLDLQDGKQVNEMILNPEFGAYNRVLTWSFEYASRNVDPPPGILIATRWNYGKKARENNRDFFDFREFGRFIKDILDTKDPGGFLSSAKKYAEANISEVSKDFLLLEEKFKRNVIGVNLSDFPVDVFFRNVFSHLKPEHFTTEREEFVSSFIFHFLKQFREASSIEKGLIINDHPIYHYVSFIDKELGIMKKEELMDKFERDEKSLCGIFPEPELLKPTLSDEGFDAFLILKLIEQNASEHFHSFIISTYLRKRHIDFDLNYLNISKKLKTEDFQTHVKGLEKALSKFGSDFSPLNLNNDLLKFLAIWWEYYQFTFIGETITKNIRRHLLDTSTKSQIRKSVSDERLNALCQFLKNYIVSSRDYIEALKEDESSEQILSQLEEMESSTEANSVFEYLFKKAASSNSSEYPGNPFFPSLGSFERWVDELIEKLKL